MKKVIGTDAESLAHYALKVVPDAAEEAGGSADRVLNSLRQRLAEWWPAFETYPRFQRPIIDCDYIPKWKCANIAGPLCDSIRDSAKISPKNAPNRPPLTRIQSRCVRVFDSI